MGFLARREPVRGDRRTITKFLFLPLCLWNREVGRKEWRWLETARIRQRYSAINWRSGYAGWEDVEWAPYIKEKV